MAQMYQQLIVSHDGGVTGDIQRDLYAETGLTGLAGLKIKNYLDNITSGAHPGAVKTRVNAARASGTITLSAMVATDTVTVNGIVFTCMASGAVGNQFNVGGTDTLTGDALVAALLANTTLAAMITAANVAGVVTVTALDPGAIGNALTLAISAHGSVSAARLAGGTNGDTETTHNFGSNSTF